MKVWRILKLRLYLQKQLFYQRMYVKAGGDEAIKQALLPLQRAHTLRNAAPGFLRALRPGF